MKQKIETLDNIINFYNMIKKQFDVHVKRMRSDNGTKFTNSSFQACIHIEGINYETSCVATTQ